MRPGYAAGGADAADHLTVFNVLPFTNVDPGKVRQQRKQSGAVIDYDGVARKVQIARNHHATAVRRVHRRAGRAQEIGAAVRIAREPVEHAARAERTVGRLADRALEWSRPQRLRRRGLPDLVHQFRFLRDTRFDGRRRRDEIRIDGEPTGAKRLGSNDELACFAGRPGLHGELIGARPGIEVDADEGAPPTRLGRNRHDRVPERGDVYLASVRWPFDDHDDQFAGLQRPRLEIDAQRCSRRIRVQQPEDEDYSFKSQISATRPSLPKLRFFFRLTHSNPACL